ncbi:MAG: anthranilate/aminodeoxychorismate synthase component II [Candidatus Melainabacteria bacterium RIFCSPLOWO2_02_FULL_35_15]|nr:MAG: anthranilate/aminodeoxychorismate synthase component II [Candidatus Melainabacteria bacterium RIFCSPLOWO2_12_FULL_35_11]OGI13217.1 MAG: anthranilate/aminodeoxychorismate synthase component II [Candidatus Melainabacteria bacterium RIFCSPLOWO2_02_FULL_35_15]
MSVLVIDNYDSFTYNLVQYLGELKQDVLVYRNDEITVDKIRDIKPAHIVISPGPGRPDDAGISKSLIQELAGKIPILGVCLGHQCIGEVFGGKITNAPVLMHGKTSEIFHEGNSIFTDIPNPFIATRYHSLIIDLESIKDKPLRATAKTKDNLIMALVHKDFKNLTGVQFHPESILTEHGHKLLSNFLRLS